MVRPAIVLYDVADDRRRADVRALLSVVGVPFQQSGWLIPSWADTDTVGLWRGLVALTRRGDRVRLHRPCRSCQTAAATHPAGSLALASSQPELLIMPDVSPSPPP